MAEAFICAYLRTPIGRFGGALSSVRADDLGAVPLRALMERHPSVDFAAVDEVIFGCANQAGEDNRNVGARLGLLGPRLSAPDSRDAVRRSLARLPGLRRCARATASRRCRKRARLP